MNLKYLGEGEVRKIMKSLGMICHIYIYNVKQDLQPYTQLSPINSDNNCEQSQNHFSFFLLLSTASFSTSCKISG